MKSRKKQLAAGALAIILGMFPWTSSSLQAVDQSVGPGQTPYSTLHMLQSGGPLGVPPAHQFSDNGDTITLRSNVGVFSDNTLLNFFGLDGKSATWDGRSVSYGNDHILGYSLGMAKPQTGSFINAAPDNNNPHQTLTLRQVRIAGFGETAVVTSYNGAGVGYNIIMDGGAFVRNGAQFNDTTGGAIWINGSSTGATLWIDNYGRRDEYYAPSFYGNYKHGTSSDGYGGAIYATSAHVVINEAFFGYDPRLRASDLQLHTNTAYETGNQAVYGGAIYISGLNTNALSNTIGTHRHRISNTEFYNNEAEEDGGTIYTNSNLDIYGSVFGTGVGSVYGVGGTNLDDWGNIATRGAGIYFEAGLESSRSSLRIGAVEGRNYLNQEQIVWTKFGYNKASESGAGIYYEGTTSTTPPSDVYHSSTLYIDDTIFFNNVAQGWKVDDIYDRSYPWGGQGGAGIYATQTSVYIGTGSVEPINAVSQTIPPITWNPGGVTFSDNVATLSGGGIRVAGYKIGSFNDVISTLNVGVDPTKVTEAYGFIENRFHSNRAGVLLAGGATSTEGYGGAIYGYNSNVNINPNTIFSTGHLSDNLANGNSARYGGAIAVNGEGSDQEWHFDLSVKGSTFLYGRATDDPTENVTSTKASRGSGGAIWVEGARLNLSSYFGSSQTFLTTFGSLETPIDATHELGNHAYEHGGAIYLSKINNVVDASNALSHVIEGVGFYRNIARSIAGDTAQQSVAPVSTSGGAIFVTQSHAVIQGQTADVNVQRNEFVENVATMREYNPTMQWTHGGGAIALTDVAEVGVLTSNQYLKTQLTLSESDFVSNVAGSGYAVDPVTGVDAKTNGDNRGGGNGGAILANNTFSFNVSNSTFAQNSAWAYRNAAGDDSGGYGGAIAFQRYLQGKTGEFFPDANDQTITNSTFIENVSQNYGGAISAMTLALVKNGVHPEDQHGEQLLSVVVDGSGLDGQAMFEGNKSLMGGAIYGRSSEIAVRNVAFDSNAALDIMYGGNRANAVGGAIAMDGGDVDFGVDPAEFIAGKLVVDNSVFTANTARDAGGAVYTVFSISTISDSTFGDENDIDVNDYTDRNKALQGGAIALNKSHRDAAKANLDDNAIKDAKFYGNIARDYEVAGDFNSPSKGIVRGGAVLVYQTSATISATADQRVEFVANRAERNTNAIPNGELLFNGGGAIAVANNPAEPDFAAVLKVYSTDFRQNSARGNGGAIHAADATLLFVQDSTFDGNYANKYNKVDGGGDGGAVALYRTDGTVGEHHFLTTTFTGNTADSRGGAIYAQGIDANNPVRVDIGAIRANQPDPNVAKSTFQDNEAWVHGGAIYATFADLYVSNTDFDSNRASSATGNPVVPPTATGGAIALSGGALTMVDQGTGASQTTFTNNEAEFRGGAVWVGNEAVANIKNAAFGTQSVELDGEGEPVLDENGKPVLVVSNGNRAMQGGAIYYDGPSIDLNGDAANHTIETSAFYGNTAAGSAAIHDIFGGAVAVANGASLDIFGTDFYGNTVAPENFAAQNEVFGGGAIAVIGDGQGNGVLTLGNKDNKRTTFTKNVAEGNGGAIYAKDSPNVTVSADFTGNEALNLYDGRSQYIGGGQGGAIYAIGDLTQLTTNSSTFDSNKAEADGGAIYVDGVIKVETNKSTFIENVAVNDGGAVYARNTEFVQSNGSTYTGNSAGGNGGALAVLIDRQSLVDSTIVLTDTDFFDNSAEGRGGAVSVSNTSNKNVSFDVVADKKNVVFKGNSDSKGSNDIYLRGVASTFDAAGNAQNATLNRTISINSGIDSDSALTKVGQGVLQVNADSSLGSVVADNVGGKDYALNISEGMLNIGRNESDVNGSGAVITVNGDALLQAGATLGVEADGRYAVTGAKDEAALTVLGNFDVVDKAYIELTGLSLDYVPPVDTEYPDTSIKTALYTLVSAENKIEKDNYVFSTPGAFDNSGGVVPFSEDYFLWYNEIRVDDESDPNYNGNKVQFGAGLVWNNTADNSAHGTFFIDGGKSFTLGAHLQDNTTVPDSAFNGWDGKTLKKTGTGTLILSTANYYTGDTLVQGGTLAAAHANSAGYIDSVGLPGNRNTDNIVRVSQDATFQVGAYTSDDRRGVTGELVNLVTGLGNFAVDAGPNGVVTINNVNDYTGLTTVKSGTLLLKNIGGTGGNTVDRFVQIDGGAYFELDLGTDDLNMRLRGDGSLVKSGSGTVTVTSANRGTGSDYYHGTTIIKGGRLVADNATGSIVDALGDGAVQFVANAASPSTLVLSKAGTFDNRITGDGNVELTSGGTTILSNGSSDYSGKTDVLNGTDLIITHVNATGRNVSTTDTPGPVTLQNADSTLYFDIALDDQTYHKQVLGAGSVVKRNDNKLTLTNGGSNFNGLDILGGELVITHVNAGGSGTVNVADNAIFQIAAAGTFTNAIIGNATGNEVIINPGAGNTTTITADNKYGGKTTVLTGTAKITQSTGTGVNLADRVVDIREGATLDLGESQSTAVNGDYNKKLIGDGALVKSSSKTVTLTNENEHKNTHVKNGQLNIEKSTGLGRGTTTLDGGTTLGLLGSLDGLRVTNQIHLAGNATINAESGKVSLTNDISGYGRLTKTGAGWLALDGDSKSFSGGLNINNGGIVVTNQNALGSGPVNNLASLELNLEGNHTLRSDIATGSGTLIKSGQGRLDVDHILDVNRFRMTGGTLAVDLGHSYIKAANGFTINNSTLVGKYDGSENLRRGEENGTRFLALDGANSNSFGKYLFESLSHVDWRVVTEGDKLYYELWTKAFTEAYGDKLSYNANQAAGGVDRLPEDDPINTALRKLTDSEDLVRAFSQLHGEVYKTAMYAEADLQRNFNEHLLRRSLPCEHCYRFKGFRGQQQRTRELWATVGGGGNFRTSFDRYSGYNIGRWGVTAGLEQLFDRNFFVGVAIGYDQADMKLKDLWSKDDFYAFRVAAYTSYTYEDWSFNGFLGYAKNWHDVEREIDFMKSTARSKFDDDICTFGAEMRKLFHINTMDFIPSIGVNYVHVSAPMVTENGAGAASLYVHRDKYSSFRVPVGFRLNSRFDMQGIELKPEVRMFYTPEFGDSKVRGTTAFASDPSIGFIADAGVRSRHSFRIGVGLQAKLFERLSVGVDYDGEIYSRYSRHDVGGNVTVRW